uniref:Uncharacterized protein n=1 Tax=Anguilla anguilla TaxID=7936 RepID=A0A0E9XPH3_ANGAN
MSKRKFRHQIHTVALSIRCLLTSSDNRKKKKWVTVADNLYNSSYQSNEQLHPSTNNDYNHTFSN